MIIAGILGSLLLLLGIVCTPWALAEHWPKWLKPRAHAEPTLTGAFLTGALAGAFAGIIPAAIAFALSRSGGVFAFSLALCSLAGGAAWRHFERRIAAPRAHASSPVRLSNGRHG
jgi:hypothetical protein